MSEPGDRRPDAGSGPGPDHAPKPPTGWMDRPDFVKRLFLAFYVICGVLLIADLVMGHPTEHPHPYEGPPGFYAVYGFVSFWFLVLLAKPMRKLLIRPEDYYATDPDGNAKKKGGVDAE